MTQHPPASRGHVLLFKGKSQYDTVRCMTDDFAEGFRAAGFGTTLVDLDGHDEAAQEAVVCAAHAEGTLAFGLGFYGWGCDIAWRADGTIWDRLQVPYVQHMIDPPYVMHQRMLAVANQVVLVHDEAMVDWVAACTDIRGSRGACQPGGPMPNPARLRRPRKGRPLVSMTVHDMRTLDATLQGMPPSAQDFVRRLIEIGADDPHAALHVHALEVLRGFGWLEMGSMRSRELGVFRSYMHFAYDYVHALRRARLAPQILRLPVEIAGRGWEQFKVPSRKAALRGPMGFRQVEARLAETPFLLNVMPPWSHALHDRVLYAMAQGAPVLTTTNHGIDTVFRDGHDLLCFRLDGEDLAAKVDALMTNAALRDGLADAAQATLAAGQTWRHRADTVAAAVAAHLEHRNVRVA